MMIVATDSGALIGCGWKSYSGEINTSLCSEKRDSFLLCWSLTYVLEFENVSSPFSFRWYLLLWCRSFVFGASESCRPPVDLLLGLESKTIHLSIQLQIRRLCLTASIKQQITHASMTVSSFKAVSVLLEMFPVMTHFEIWGLIVQHVNSQTEKVRIYIRTPYKCQQTHLILLSQKPWELAWVHEYLICSI